MNTPLRKEQEKITDKNFNRQSYMSLRNKYVYSVDSPNKENIVNDTLCSNVLKNLEMIYQISDNNMKKSE